VTVTDPTDTSYILKDISVDDDALTMTAWIYLDNDLDTNQTFLKIKKSTIDSFIVRLNDTEHLFLAIKDEGGATINYYSATALTQGVWYKLRFIADGGDVHLYVNDTAEVVNQSSAYTQGDTFTSIYIGDTSGFDNDSYYIDDFHLYDSAIYPIMPRHSATNIPPMEA